MTAMSVPPGSNPQDSPSVHEKLPDLPPALDIGQILDSTLSLNDHLPGLVKGESTAILLDLNNFYGCAKSNGFKIDYAKLLSIIDARCDVRYKAAFTADDPGNEDVQRWIHSMRKIGYTLFTKPLRAQVDSKTGIVGYKGNLDIEMAVEAMSLPAGISHVILGTCDGDFIPVVEKLRKGSLLKVSILGIDGPSVSTMSKDLIASVSVDLENTVKGNFYNMYDFREHVTKVSSRTA